MWFCHWAWAQSGFLFSRGNCSGSRFCRFTIRAWKEWRNMPPVMDKQNKLPIASPGYETRDVHVGAILNFLVILTVIILATVLTCWGIFRYFAANQDRSAA